MMALRRQALTLGSLVIGLVFSTQVLAGPDRFYPGSAGWSVNAVANGNITNDFTMGADGHTTLNTDVHASDAIAVTAGWRILDRSEQPGADTSYPRTVTFTAATAIKPVGAADVLVLAIAQCPVTSASSTCSTAIAFSAPPIAGPYRIDITPNTGVGGGGPLTAHKLSVNFNVAEAQPVSIDTKLTVAPRCYALNDGDVDLTATLEELVSGMPIANADIDFTLDSVDIGTAATGADGVAKLVYNINGLGVGDYTLYGEFGGNATYNSSNDSNTLGIAYVFLGFGKPIDPGGVSIFGGRVIPIKIRLADANGKPVEDATPMVWLHYYDNDLGLGDRHEQVPSSVSAADTDNIMRYDPIEKQYIYNWNAMDLANGVYAVVVDLGDSPTCRSQDPYAVITVNRRGGGPK